MRGFVLEGDEQKIAEPRQADVQRPLAAPSTTAHGARTCCCSWADSTAFPASPRRSTAGGRRAEIMASFWIPVMAGGDLGPTFVAERLVLAVPYIFVDNPMRGGGLRLREDDGALPAEGGDRRA